jgi:hypothetical protein
MTAFLATLGIVLIVVAIPLGMMLAPLAIGVILVWFGLRRLGDTLDDSQAIPSTTSTI